MTAPRLTITIPTIGRPTLERTLRSIREQAHGLDVEILVIGDCYTPCFAAALARVPALALRYGAAYAECHDGPHAWGHPARNLGARWAAGAWLLWSQDDSVLTPDALTHLWPLLAPHRRRRPIIGQVETWQAGRVWQTPDLRCGNVDADGWAVPNDPARLGTWPPVYEGDYQFLAETVARYDDEALWLPQVLAVGRPERCSWPPTLVAPALL